MNLRYKPDRHFKLNMHGAFGYGIINWFTVLYNNKFKIQFSAIPKVLWITMAILSTHVFRLFEKLRYTRAVKKVKIKEPIFIVGYPRSGTTFLHYLMSKDERFSYGATYQVLMPNIFLSLGSSIVKIMKNFLPKTRLIDNMKMGSNLPKEEEFAISAMSDASIVNGFYFPQNLWTYLRRYVMFEDDEKYAREWKKKMYFFLQKLNYKSPEKQLLLKSPFNTARIQQILEMFPDAKFIHIHRNPYEVYYSNEKLYETLMPLFAFHEVDNRFMEEFIFDSYKQVYGKYIDSLSLIPEGRLTTISYEDLVNDPISLLRKVYKDLDIDDFESASPQIEFELSSYKDYKTNEHYMTEEVKKRIRQEWAAYFEEFGYVSTPKVKLSPSLKAV
ncbi:MAG TPA: sulfotransferase [Cytophagaceae bacterium]|nr:sulfotransferase [Cytophagaceae bacterium]